MINIARAIQHPFEDRDWVTKFLIGAGVSLVPVLNFAMLGYSLDVLRNTEQGRDTPLPSWNDLGNQFVEGLKLWVAQLLYVLPIIGLSLLFAFGSTMLGIAAGSGRREAGSAAAAAISFGSLALTGVAVLYALAIGIITPALYIQVARARAIGAAFDFRAITTTIRQRLGDYVLVLVLMLAVGLIFGFVFAAIVAIPVIGLCSLVFMVPLAILFGVYLQIACAHLVGQIARMP